VFQPNLITVVVVVQEKKKNMIMDADAILLMVKNADVVLQNAQRNVVQSAVPDVEVAVPESEVDGGDIKLSLQVLFFAYLSDK